jgi:hypothetical protein
VTKEVALVPFFSQFWLSSFCQVIAYFRRNLSMSEDVAKGVGSPRLGPISRRSFLVGSGAAGAAAVITLTPVGAQDATPMAGMTMATPTAGVGAYGRNRSNVAGRGPRNRRVVLYG